MKTLIVIAVSTFLVSVIITKLNGIKNDKNVWDIQ
jgi:hypothetical protein